MSKKDYGCFFCLGKSSEFHGTCPACHKPINIGEHLLKAKLNEYVPDAVLGRGYYGWTLKANDVYQPFAIKVVPRQRLKGAKIEDKEVRALVACSAHRHIARFIRTMNVDVKILGESVGVLCIVFEFIPNALPLSKVFADNSLVLDKADVVAILAGIASGLERMHANGLWHDDLHDDNVLLRKVMADENLNEKYEAKLIDFGSAKPLRTGEPESGEHCDYYYLAKHVFNLVDRFEFGNQGSLAAPDRAFSSRLRRLAHRLADRNVSRRSLNPSEVRKELHAALDECATGQNFPSFADMKRESHVSFSEPLENTNALSLAPQDIALLFQDSLGWRERIVKSEPVLVVGPRGCGKTMFLRFLSIVSCARPLEQEREPSDTGKRLGEMKHMGFLVNVGQLRTPFLRSSFKSLEASNPHLAEDFCREFLNCHFAFEVIRTFIWLADENIVPFSRDDLNLIRSAVEDLLIEPCEMGRRNLESLAEVLDRRVIALSNLSDPNGYQPTRLCSDDVLQRLAQAIRRTAWGRSKEVWFLLDDYSVTVLPEIAQRAYNPVLFRLSADVRIKASSEGDGPILSDNLNRKYKEGRELTKLNLGEIYFQAKEDDGRKFFEEILKARFRETGKGSLDELLRLLGRHPHEDRFGEHICSLKRPGDVRFHGFGLLCRLCSGDVSFIIELLHALTKGSWEGNARPLTPKQQDDIIKRFAQRQLAELHATAEHGESLYAFATGLGRLIKEYLLKSKGKEADERLRVEVEKWEELSRPAQIIHDALLRHSVLVSGGAGKSKEGLPTRKFFFRRIFAPCFPFSPTRHGCVDLNFSEYEKWLLDPKCICAPPETGEDPGTKQGTLI